MGTTHFLVAMNEGTKRHYDILDAGHEQRIFTSRSCARWLRKFGALVSPQSSSLREFDLVWNALHEPFNKWCMSYLWKVIWNFALVSLYDIVISSWRSDEHNGRAWPVLTFWHKSCVTLDVGRVVCFIDCIDYLSHIICAGLLNKHNWRSTCLSTPQRYEKLWSFMGLCKLVCHFGLNLSCVASSRRKRLHKAQQRSFDGLVDNEIIGLELLKPGFVKTLCWLFHDYKPAILLTLRRVMAWVDLSLCRIHQRVWQTSCMLITLI